MRFFNRVRLQSTPEASFINTGIAPDKLQSFGETICDLATDQQLLDVVVEPSPPLVERTILPPLKKIVVIPFGINSKKHIVFPDLKR